MSEVNSRKDWKQKILQVLQSSSHRWRTARGIAKDAGLAVDDVIAVLDDAPEVARSKKAGSHGQALFALREKRASPGDEEEGNMAEASESVPEEVAYLQYFVLLPLDASMRRLRDTIGRTLREERAVPFFVDELPAGAAWVDDVAQRIRSSHVVVADITRLNPNVMFELGIAHGLGKPLILLISEAEDVDLPSDLVGYQYLMYAPDNLSSFVERLRRTARQLQARKGAAK